ncbi:hypothetical protein AI3013V2_4745 (plasmid) [Enterobacter cloacae]|nr:hypothetical protein AI3013V2_4745 [Enterobacter cloacae]CAH5759425.1 hypothetical protein AI3013V2_4745 [Enterobacter cloacae]
MIKVHDITYGTPTSSVKDLNEWLGKVRISGEILLG